MDRLHAKELIIGDIEGQHIKIEGGQIYMTDKCLQIRAHLQVVGNGAPCLTLCDGNGNTRISIMVEQDGCPYITLNDGNHTRRLEMDLDVDDGDPSLTLFDKSEKPVLDICLDYQGVPVLRVPNEQERGCMRPWLRAKKEG